MVKSFLDLMRHEEDELEFQIKHNEISAEGVLRSKSRIAIHRQTVLNLVKQTGQDYVPELHCRRIGGSQPVDRRRHGGA